MHRMLCLVASALLATTGCKQSDEPTDEDYDDVASAVGALVTNDSGGETGSMEDSVELASGEMPAGFSSMGSGSFEGLRAGLTYAYTLTCKDDGGATQEACNGETESANLVVDWSGELDLPHYQASVVRSGDWTLSGLQSDTAHFNGHGSFDVDTEFTSFFGDRHRTFNLDYDAEYDDVTWDRPLRRFNGGSIHYQVHAERTRERRGADVEVELDISVDVEFHDDGHATVTLDGSRRYHLDVDTGFLGKE
jgi:hypothetical protein